MAKIYDYKYLGKPSTEQTLLRKYKTLKMTQFAPPVKGAEFTLVYYYIKPVFKSGQDGGAVRLRLRRADGDNTFYDDLPIDLNKLDSKGLACFTRVYFENGGGTEAHTQMQARCQGGLKSVQITTTYRKVLTLHKSA